jgi:hypothetical protein
VRPAEGGELAALEWAGGVGAEALRPVHAGWHVTGSEGVIRTGWPTCETVCCGRSRPPCRPEGRRLPRGGGAALRPSVGGPRPPGPPPTAARGRGPDTPDGKSRSRGMRPLADTTRVQPRMRVAATGAGTGHPRLANRSEGPRQECGEMERGGA